jgi:hypothetical protein
MENLVESYKELSKIAKVSLEFQFIRDDDKVWETGAKRTLENQRQMIDIIYATPSFNERNSEVIGHTFLEFYNSLPRLYLGEGNPNNGAYLFQEIRLIGDDTIELETYHTISDELLQEIAALVNSYGRKINADEHRVYKNKVTDTFGYTIIRFWWD